jgi:hypothetical protein
MKLTREQSQKLVQERGIWVTNACDRCGRLLGAVRWTRRGEPGEWCSALCRDGVKPEERKADSKTCRECGTTVHAILDKAQTEEAIVAARDQLLGMADIAIKRVQQSIKSSKREGLDASLAVLKGLGVLEERTKSQVEVKNGFESWSDEQLREFIAGRSDGPGASEEGTGTAPTDKAVH